MRHELRPMSIGGILDRALRIYLQHFWLLLSISLTLTVPVALLYLWSSTVVEDTQDAAMVLMITGIFAGGLTGALLQGTLVQAISDVFLGQEASYGRSFRLALTKFFTLLVVLILYGMVVFAGTCACILPGLFFTAAFFAAPAVAVLERKGPIDAMSRSWHLTENTRRRIFAAIAFAQYAVAGFPSQTVQLVLEHLVELDQLKTAAAVQVVVAVVQPYFSVVLILLYYDLRVRREAFDLEVLAREIGRVPAGAARP